MTCLDICQVRRLPVQLSQRPAKAMIPRKLRALMYDPNYRLVVVARDRQVAAFAGLNFSSPGEGELHFLVFDCFAADRFALKQGIADQMEAHATALAKENNAAAVLVRSEKLGETAQRFYEERGYVLLGNILMKAL